MNEDRGDLDEIDCYTDNGEGDDKPVGYKVAVLEDVVDVDGGDEKEDVEDGKEEIEFQRSEPSVFDVVREKDEKDEGKSLGNSDGYCR